QRSGTATITFAGIENLQVHKGAVAGTAPMLTDLAFPTSIQPGHSAALAGRLVDPDQGDTLTLSVDWGDGSKPETITPDRRPFHLQHRYKKAGSYKVHLVWSDSTGLSNGRDLSLTVTPKQAKSGPTRVGTSHHGPMR